MKRLSVWLSSVLLAIVASGSAFISGPVPVAQASCNTSTHYWGGASQNETTWGGWADISAQDPYIDGTCSGGFTSEWIMSDISNPQYVQGGWDEESTFSAPQIWAEFGDASGKFVDYWSGWNLNGTTSVWIYSTGSSGDWNVDVQDGSGSLNPNQPTTAVGAAYGNNFEAEGEVVWENNWMGGYGHSNAAALTDIQNYPTSALTGTNPNLPAPTVNDPNGANKYCVGPVGSLSESNNLENWTEAYGGNCSD